ncbi:MAG TPA: sigma factor [Acidimicrobiales bacterium]
MTLVKADRAGVEAEAMVNADGVDDAGRDAAAPAVGPTFEDVYRRSYRRMTKVAHLMVGDGGVAEEIVQDAFVGLYRRFDAVADHDGYLYRSVVNGCRSRFRRKQVDERVRHLRVVTEVGPPEIDEVAGWGVLSGPACLASGGGVFTFPDAGPHAFTYGVAGAGVARVRVVAADGAGLATVPGSAVGDDGFRAWLVERPVGEVASIEGLDTAGHVVATVPGAGPGAADDFGLSAGC